MDAPEAPRSPDVPSRFHVDFQGRTLLGTYRVDRRLAEGGMGAVYLAHDLNLGRRVVVKVPHVRFLAEPGFRARFRREISELVRLEHPSIVRILAQGEEEEIPFFVLQYLGGGSLEDRIARGRSTPEQVVSWLSRVAETLDYVHAQGIVHRDVKPGNILFDEQGHVFLSDFGVVKALEPSGGAELTEDGTGIGSPIYMAPEQALGKPVGPSADLYALASTVYEALTGEAPFGRGSALEVIMAKTRGEPPPIREKIPTLPPSCEQALLRALDAQPERRPPGSVAFSDAFRAGLTSASTQGVAPVPRRVAGLRWAFAAVVLVAAAGLAYRVLGSPDQAPQAPLSTIDQTPGVLLRLAKAGAEPRALLRMAPSIGAKDQVTLILHEEFAKAIEGRPEVMRSGQTQQDVAVTVDQAGPRGARLSWILAVPKSDAAAVGDMAQYQKQFEALGRGVGTSVLTARGVATDFALGYDGGSEGAEEMKFALVEMVRSLPVALPAEPVGVGAEWDATQLLDVMGVRYQETLTCRLVSRDGDRVTLTGQVRYASPPQEMAAPPGDAAKSLSLTAIEGDGSMQVVLDLHQPLPVSMTTKGVLRFAATAEAEGTTRKISFRKSYDSELKRK